MPENMVRRVGLGPESRVSGYMQNNEHTTPRAGERVRGVMPVLKIKKL